MADRRDRRRAAAEDLRATADAAERDAGRIAAIEREKGDLEAGDPAIERLSAEAVALTRRLATTVAAEAEIVRELDEPA